MNVNQLRKAIKVAKAESKVIYIAIHNSRFHIDFNNCKYRIDGTNEQLCKYAESETDCILFAQVHIIANI